MEHRHDPREKDHPAAFALMRSVSDAEIARSSAWGESECVNRRLGQIRAEQARVLAALANFDAFAEIDNPAHVFKSADLLLLRLQTADFLLALAEPAAATAAERLREAEATLNVAKEFYAAPEQEPLRRSIKYFKLDHPAPQPPLILGY